MAEIEVNPAADASLNPPHRYGVQSTPKGISHD
jgi:hypothetical protein